jgi:hypothetical protein
MFAKPQFELWVIKIQNTIKMEQNHKNIKFRYEHVILTHHTPSEPAPEVKKYCRLIRTELGDDANI